MYLTYLEYKQRGGNLDEITYNRLEYKARAAIDEATFGRAKKDNPVRESVKMLVFELVGLFDIQANSTVKSTSNDGVSETYADIDFTRELSDLISTYLSGEKTEDFIPLLYLGVGR